MFLLFIYYCSLFVVDMRVDFFLGEHLLLIGNQGVGKNKLADKYAFLFILFYLFYFA
jgi:MoxR-like ATPase